MKLLVLIILICLTYLTVFAQQEDIIKTVDGSWTDRSNFSVWKDGAFDLTNVESLRITFPSLQTGVKFYVRLLPEGVGPDLPIGLSRKFHTIPQDGVVIVPISEFEFSKVQLSNISQISIHSGMSAWQCPLNQGPMSHAVFEKIELVKHVPEENVNATTQTSPKIITELGVVYIGMPKEYLAKAGYTERKG